MLFQQKVATVDQVQFRFGQVAQERLRSRHDEEGIVLPPHDERARLVLAEVFVPRVVERHVRGVVVKEVELNGVIAGSVQQSLVEGVAVRAHRRRVFRTMRVLEDRRLLGQQRARRLLRLLVTIRPERLQRLEGGADAFHVSIAVLHDDAFDRFRMTRGNAETDGRAVILHVDAEFLQTQPGKEQLLDLRGDVVEGVSKVGRRGSIAVAKAEVVRRDNVEVAGELRDQFPEHVRRRRKAMKQNDRRIRGRAGLAVEDLVALDGRHAGTWSCDSPFVNPIVCTRERRTGRFQHELYDGGWLRNLRGMIHVVRTDLCAHAVGYKTLCFWAEHSIVFSQ